MSPRFPLDGALVREVSGLWQWARPADYRFPATALPGHLIHFVVRGRLFITWQKKTFTVNEGEMIYYYSNAPFIFETREKPLIFQSIGFYAPLIVPGGDDVRPYAGDPRIALFFRSAARAMAANQAAAFYARLNAFIARLISVGFLSEPISQNHRHWWQVENHVRRDFQKRFSLADLKAISGLSSAALARDCQACTGLTPIRRVKTIKLNRAKTLLLSPDTNVSDVAYAIGYFRIHEFSRDFKKMFGVSPKRYREEVKVLL